MENTEALRIIRILADGIDPITGEVFDVDSPYQNPSIIRALFAAISLMERQAERERKGSRLPPKAGQPWEAREEEAVLSAFKSGVSIGEIARQHSRTHGAIEARLAKHGLIDERARRFMPRESLPRSQG